MKNLDGTRIWLFDLDDTLYPAASGLGKVIEARILEYFGKNVPALSAEEIDILQTQYVRTFGTATQGLHNMHPEIDLSDYIEQLTDIDYSILPPNPPLGEAIARLPGRKFVLTNGPRLHAQKVLARLDLGDIFEGIFSVDSTEAYISKPNPIYYQAFIDEFDVDPDEAAMFDDGQHNLKPAHDLGMTTVWLKGSPYHKVKPIENAPYVDFETDDLETFLRSLKF